MEAVIVRDRIEKQLPHLTGRERQIARHMIERYPVSALGGIEDIAQQSAVSAPTVTRFVRRLGFHRFVDFQRAIRLEIQEQEASPLALLHQHRGKSEDPLSLDVRLVETLKQGIELLKTDVLSAAFDAAAALLGDKRRRVYMLGGRWSSIAAQYFGYQLATIRGRVEVLVPPPSGVIEDRIADFAKRDLVVVYDFRRYQPQTIDFVEKAVKRGVSVILFTDHDLSPISDFSDVVVAIPVALDSPLDTLVPALAATDAILARLVVSLGDQAERRIRTVEGLRQFTGENGGDAPRSG